MMHVVQDEVRNCAATGLASWRSVKCIGEVIVKALFVGELAGESGEGSVLGIKVFEPGVSRLGYDFQARPHKSPGHQICPDSNVAQHVSQCSRHRPIPNVKGLMPLAGSQLAATR